MSAKNPEYDFNWCPGCGDFAVRRALEWALQARTQKLEVPMTNNVIVTGIGCSGNLVHLIEGEQPFGFHGIHGRTLPVAFGIKSSRPEVNVVVVAGDGDFLSIGLEHIGPQAQRNIDVACIVIDNGIYGLTKGQSSPTTRRGFRTATTPYGKIEQEVAPLPLYLALDVSFVASHFSGRPRDLAKLIERAMDHRGFAIVHVASPCPTYNDTTELLRGNPRKGIPPLVWDVPEDHDPTDRAAAAELVARPGVPLGLLYVNERPTFNDRLDEATAGARVKGTRELLESHVI
ncbi:MAG: 2-oxoacid:ferredoxin oxidoreductase subunit beta [Gemmatimonadetes bacterium]|nr:2-oxoacid:ferredoxin oxidoreductase subunit beta [Gemmatimonadota bacterium]